MTTDVIVEAALVKNKALVQAGHAADTAGIKLRNVTVLCNEIFDFLGTWQRCERKDGSAWSRIDRVRDLLYIVGDQIDGASELLESVNDIVDEELRNASAA